MKSLLERRLDLILENDTTQVGDDPYQAAQDIAAELEAARRKVTDLERQLMFAMDRIAGGLAMGVRKEQPGLNVGVDQGACKVGYKSQNLTVQPDLVKRVWIVNSHDPAFAQAFNQTINPTNAPAPPMQQDGDLSDLAQAISDFFSSQLRAVGESITGRGVIMVKGKRADMGELAEYVRRCDRVLSESGRRRSTIK